MRIDGHGGFRKASAISHLWLLVDPVELSRLVALDLTLLEPESNLLLGVLDAVGTVADVAANVNGEVTTDGTGGGSQGVGGTEEDYRRFLVRKGVSVEKLVGLYIPRPVLTASRPSQTMAQMGPLIMSVYRLSVYCQVPEDCIAR